MHDREWLDDPYLGRHPDPNPLPVIILLLIVILIVLKNI
ncbi:hypothetical protein BN863_28810 [Formosa agariphila KMM 3901]|uniref:Uncharacterized protein n=1 Tax=Formosa agariphila (strain DSM 15362 / KCTC 12365 / LMG 23005 / KMM 3901 / M-2Alg 35-1) TaxID=1347342 RepID=T2KQ09_FORAG|nr:hypothetical protein BN863_28810 [Formosa agariphila KMM 3901]